MNAFKYVLYKYKYKFHLPVKHLHAVIIAITNHDLPQSIRRHSRQTIELSLSISMTTELSRKLAVDIKHLNPMVTRVSRQKTITDGR